MSEREKISFHQLHKQTGNRIKYKKVDAETGREVKAGDIVKGYEVGKGEYIELDPDEMDTVRHIDTFGTILLTGVKSQPSSREVYCPEMDPKAEEPLQ